MEHADISELVKNERFLNYCFNRNESDVRYWENWIKDNPQHADQVRQLRDMTILLAKETQIRVKSANFQELSRKINSQKHGLGVFRWIKTRKVAVYMMAALMLLFIGVFLFWYQSDFSASWEVSDVEPGGNKAILTLADGQQVSLGQADFGSLANEHGIAIEKVGDGQLIYTILNDSETPGDEQKTSLSLETTIAFNKITTPKGGQFQVNLPDGTKVWLNAESSISYAIGIGQLAIPTREVELTGEGYFEVSHLENAKGELIPFAVRTKKQHIRVLGTSFNVSSYSNEPFETTTLLDGTVKVNAGKQSLILDPGQEAVVGDQINIREVNTAEVLAWKNGMFVFNDEPLESIMQKIARWYDVDVAYDTAVDKKELYGGSFSRDENISHVLRKLELTGGVRFRIERHRDLSERRVWVMR